MSPTSQDCLTLQKTSDSANHQMVYPSLSLYVKFYSQASWLANREFELRSNIAYGSIRCIKLSSVCGFY